MADNLNAEFKLDVCRSLPVIMSARTNFVSLQSDIMEVKWCGNASRQRLRAYFDSIRRYL